jgi:hypothetical protein
MPGRIKIYNFIIKAVNKKKVCKQKLEQKIIEVTIKVGSRG